MSVADWRKQAEALFFIEKKKIKEISIALGVSHRSISEHLNSLAAYTAEVDRRKADNSVKRKEYQRNWDRNNRAGRYGVVNADTLKQEHITAVNILSREKYYG